MNRIGVYNKSHWDYIMCINSRTRSKSKSTNSLTNLLNFALFIEPKTVNEALACDEAEKWKNAMDDEMNSHKLNNTWTLVQQPPGINIVKSK